MLSKEKSIFRRILVPLILVMVLQAVVSYGVILFSGTVRMLNDNSVHILSQTTENRKIILENAMLQDWSHVDTAVEVLNQELENIQKKENIDTESFMADGSLQKELLLNSMDKLIMELRRRGSTGIFVILANEDEGSRMNGLYVRDSNPVNDPADYSDLLLERGPADISHKYGIAFDTFWAANYDLSSQESKDSGWYNYYYEPYEAALYYDGINYKNFEYWSMPFYLNGDKNQDFYEIITYSVPLISGEGTVYGVMGVEISVSYLTSMMPGKEVEGDELGGYFLIEYEETGQCNVLAYSGSNLKQLVGRESCFELGKTKYANLNQMINLCGGRDDIYGARADFELYDVNSPFEEQRWALLSVVNSKSLFGIGERLMVWVLLAVVVSLLFGIMAIFYVSNHITKPIRGLAECIRNSKGGERLPPYHTDVAEVEELYTAIDNVTEKQRRTEMELREERERYLIALKGSTDIIMEYEIEPDRMIIYDIDEDEIDLCKQAFIGFKELIMVTDVIYEEDKGAVLDYINTNGKGGNLVFRAKLPLGAADYQWMEVKGKLIFDADNRPVKIITNVRNIHAEKMKELKELNTIRRDGTTGLLKRKVGEYQVQRDIQIGKKGFLMLADVDNFSYLNSRYGVVFGDMLLEEISGVLKRLAGEEDILIRCGGDEIMAWLLGTGQENARDMAENFLKQVKSLYTEQGFELSISAGIAQSQPEESFENLLEHAELALKHAKLSGKGCVKFYDAIAEEKWPELFAVKSGMDEIASLNYEVNLDIVTLAFNLFDKVQDIPNAIPVLLAKLGRVFRLTDIVISYDDSEFYTNHVAFQWHRSKERAIPCQVKKFTSEEFTVCMSYLGYPGFEFDHTGQVPDTIKNFFYIPGSSNGICYAMYDNGECIGGIMFAGSMELRFTEEERYDLQEIAKIISANIGKSRSDLASKAKSDFLSRMSHEIRTPMNAIIGMTDIALRKKDDKEKMEECLQKINKSSKYLLSLISDILDMSKIESGKIILRKSEFCLSRSVMAVQDLLKPQMDEIDLEFTIHREIEDDYVVGDPLRLNQILINLLNNSIKFTPAGGWAKLSVIQEKKEEGFGSYFFSVRDNGIGIEKEQLDLIFRAFEQADQQVETEGIGLGLAICSSLVRLMGGKLEVTSKPGQGSEFFFTLCLPLSGVVAESDKAAEHVYTGDFRGRHILLAEDNELNTEIAVTLLEMHGFQIDTVEDGQKAVEIFAASAPGTYDAILMDIRMPVLDGLGATKAIRRLPREDAGIIPIIAMTANAFDEDMKKSIDSGMNGYLAKPIDTRDLLELLDSVMNKGN